MAAVADGDFTMTTRMLIDARHQEETRVAVLKGNRIDEFDFESADHKQIKGNIYLAKVTRVEPSLQAAFVDFGGNRHGFLAFSEIHPDYYQIPKQDRDALLAEEAAHLEEEAALRAAEDDDGDDHHDDDGDDFDGDDYGGLTEVDTAEKDEVATIEDGEVEGGFDHAAEDADESDDGTPANDDGGESDDGQREGRQQRGRRRQGGRGQSKSREADALRDKRMALRRRYKIQDVIQRRQVLLVQVVKEERGNKGAALTTYLSLAGRYCVLMPNSSHGGGISRKISSGADRKRLKSIIGELDLPKSMGCIVRTAGLSRTKAEIKRDFDYLARLWDGIRENTLGSSAPAAIHSDSDLIKRAIRDIYNKDIEEVVVEGEHGYRAARDFMKLLMPSHVKKVTQYADPVPLFQRYGAEDQLTAMYDPEVQLKSGGYIVINPTEALVSIDINSGRSTKEHGIEATALNTNLEAAREIARQLRLRDMAGLVVIDFIDMDFNNNVRKVEKAMKDALKNDRARIQVGRISSFGLMEMSRQRLRTGVLEATTRGCPHCDGTGLVRTAGSSGLAALRLIEDEAAKGCGSVISLYASTEATIYLLNAKRADLAEIEERYGVRVEVLPEGENEGAKMRVASSGPRPEFVPKFETITLEEEDEPEIEDDYDDEDTSEESRDSDGEDRGKRPRKRRRRGGRDRGDDAAGSGEARPREVAGADAKADDADEAHAGDETAELSEDGEGPRKRRRRGRRRRGGRDRGEGGEGSEANGSETADADGETGVEPEEAEAAEAPAKPRRGRRSKADIAAAEAEAAEVVAEPEAPAQAAEAAPAEKPKRTRKKKADAEAEAAPAVEAEPESAAPAAEEAPAKPKRSRKKVAEPETDTVADGTEAEGPSGSSRRGWWQRTFGE
jgi:ribonuclease E